MKLHLKMNKVDNDRNRQSNNLPDLVIVSLMGHLVNVGEALYFHEFQLFKAKIESFLEGVNLNTANITSMNAFEARKDARVQVVEGFFPFPNVGNCLPNSVAKLARSHLNRSMALQSPFNSVFYAAHERTMQKFSTNPPPLRLG